MTKLQNDKIAGNRKRVILIFISSNNMCFHLSLIVAEVLFFGIVRIGYLDSSELTYLWCPSIIRL